MLAADLHDRNVGEPCLLECADVADVRLRVRAAGERDGDLFR